jgi:four helix bundle protein
MNHKELDVWKISIDLVTHVYELTKNFPSSEMFGLTSQMRRSAISISSNIAEGAGRNYTKEFIHFLSIAKGSTVELETQLIISQRIGYTTNEMIEEMLQTCSRIIKMLTGMIQKLK